MNVSNNAQLTVIEAQEAAVERLLGIPSVSRRGDGEVAPEVRRPIEWIWSTYTINGNRYRFQGRRSEESQNCWYIHVCRLTDGEWVRVSYGWFAGGTTLPAVAQAWALAYVSSHI